MTSGKLRRPRGEGKPAGERPVDCPRRCIEAGVELAGHAAAVFAGRCASVEPVACCAYGPFRMAVSERGVITSCNLAPAFGEPGGDATEAGEMHMKISDKSPHRHIRSQAAIIAVALSGAALLVRASDGVRHAEGGP